MGDPILASLMRIDAVMVLDCWRHKSRPFERRGVYVVRSRTCIGQTTCVSSCACLTVVVQPPCQTTPSIGTSTAMQFLLHVFAPYARGFCVVRRPICIRQTICIPSCACISCKAHHARRHLPWTGTSTAKQLLSHVFAPHAQATTTFQMLYVVCCSENMHDRQYLHVEDTYVLLLLQHL